MSKILYRVNLNIRNNTNKHAFSLAEVLLTLSVIGVIAALTIPNFLNNIEEQKWARAREKAVYTVRNVASLLSADYDGLNNVGTNNI